MARIPKLDMNQEDSYDSNSNSNDEDEDIVEDESESFPTPASYTKHLDILYHPLPKQPEVHLQLTQLSSSSSSSTTSDKSGIENQKGGGEGGGTGTTGTTLWLSSQILTAYLSSSLLPSSKSKRVLELGSGIGYTSISLASQGWQVISTDIEPVLSTVLKVNAERCMDHLKGLQLRERGMSMTTGTSKGNRDTKREIQIPIQVGDVVVKELDWVTCANKWSRTQKRARERERCKHCGGRGREKVIVDQEEAGFRTENDTGSHEQSNCVGSFYRQEKEKEKEDECQSSTKDTYITAINDTRWAVEQETKDTLSWLDDEEGWDMLIMTDTVYATHLIDPLWDTVAYLSWISMGKSSANGVEKCRCTESVGIKEVGEKEDKVGFRLTQKDDEDTPNSSSNKFDTAKSKSKAKVAPPIYIALEARDPFLIKQAIERGKEKGFTLTKIGRGRIERSLRDVGWDWKVKDWDDVQVWKGRWGGRGGWTD